MKYIRRKIKSKFMFTSLFILSCILYYIKVNSITNINQKHHLNNDPTSTKTYTNTSWDKNFLCDMPYLDYKNKVSLDYLEADAKRQKKKFKPCAENKSIAENIFKNLIQIETITVDQLKETYRLRLDIQLLSSQFEFDKAELKCKFHRFNKKQNASERSQALVLIGNEIDMSKENNFEIVLDKEGFYYYNCSQAHFVYDNVINVLPNNMSKLLENRMASKKRVDQFKRKLNYSETNQMLYEFDHIKKCFEYEKKTKQQKMNVLMFGFDSVSYNHFRRVFPITYDYLKSDAENYAVFEHFNSVGLNTYPNLLALLTGLIVNNSGSEIDFYRKLDSTFHDILPFIWNSYEDLGYITSLIQDLPKSAVFNYIKNGFRYWPTSLYSRPLWNKYYKIRNGPDKCHKKMPTFLTYFNMVEEFISKMGAEPYFSINLLTEYTHDYLAVSESLDRHFTNLLKYLEANGYLENTLLIIFSDHGSRLTTYSIHTEIGKLERYLPFLSVRIPKHLKNTAYHKNLLENKKKLVSFFDVYQTLRHFLFINKYGIKGFKESLEKDPECEKAFKSNLESKRYLRGISLFESIPVNRSCPNAFIPKLYCNCHKKLK